MRTKSNGLKRIEAESKRFLGLETEESIEEFRQCVFEEIFRKELKYDCSSSKNINWNKEQQLYTINDNLKIKVTLEEVDERSIVNRLFRDYTEKEIKDSTAEWGIVISPKGIWLFNNGIGKGKANFQTKKTVLKIVHGINSDQDYFDFFLMTIYWVLLQIPVTLKILRNIKIVIIKEVKKAGQLTRQR